MSVRQPYPVSGGGDMSSVSNTDGTLTISPTTGDVVASIALAHANTWTGQQIFTVSPPSAPGSGSSSERFGASSVASSTNSMAIGNGATSTTGVGNIAIGQGASATGNSAMAVGYLSEASNTLSFAFGPSATASGLSSVAIGSPATVSGNGSVGIVSNVNVANTFGCGNASYPITDVFFGQGRVGSAFGYAQVDYAVNGSGGAGTDATGGHLIIAGGKSTGNAVGGSILFKTSDAGVSVTTLQSLTTKMTLDEVGNVTVTGTIAASNLSGTNTGDLAIPVPIADGGPTPPTAINNSTVMTAVGDAIVESGEITDGEGIQRNDTTFISAPLPLNTVEGRLTLTTATPITTADVTGATTVYFTPYKGDRIYLYDGTRWRLYSFSELSLALGTLTNALPYDVFIYDNAGTLTLESLAWTNGTTRATALTTQNGVLVKTGATTRRYLGTFYTTSTTETEDSLLKRFLWNYYHRVKSEMRATEATNSWTHTTATIRQANGAAGNQLACVVGVAEVAVDAFVQASAANTNANIAAYVGIGYDSTTAPTTGQLSAFGNNLVIGYEAGFFTASLRHFPAVGYHYYAWLEYSVATGTTTWLGDNGATLMQSGIHCETWG